MGPGRETTRQTSEAVRAAKAVLGRLEPRDSIDRRAIVCVIPHDRLIEMFGLPKGATVWDVIAVPNGSVKLKVVHSSFARVQEGEQYSHRVLDKFGEAKPTRIGWLGILNRYILQWLCVRLARKIDEDDKPVGWTLLRWVRPLSGYGGRPFVFLGKRERVE